MTKTAKLLNVCLLHLGSAKASTMGEEGTVPEDGAIALYP